jgi:hypothetical protein
MRITDARTRRLSLAGSFFCKNRIGFNIVLLVLGAKMHFFFDMNKKE